MSIIQRKAFPWFGFIVAMLYAACLQAAIPNSERLALIAIYNSTNGDDWVMNTGWLGAQGTECSWHGVDCGVGGVTVERLFLFENQLAGPLPPELGDLTNLQIASFDFNELTGQLPDELVGLTKLKQLGLVSNKLAGELPAWLGSMDQLERLRLRFNQFTGSIPPELGNMTKLQWLGLDNNQLTGPIPPGLGELGQLQGLVLGNNQLTGSIPPELGKLGQLYYMGLEHNQLTGPIPTELGDLVGLKFLYLNDNELSGPPPSSLMNLINLSVEGLNLRNNKLEVQDGPLLDFLHSRQVGGDFHTTQTVAQMSFSVPANSVWALLLMSFLLMLSAGFYLRRN